MLSEGRYLSAYPAVLHSFAAFTVCVSLIIALSPSLGGHLQRQRLPRGRTAVAERPAHSGHGPPADGHRDPLHADVLARAGTQH